MVTKVLVEVGKSLLTYAGMRVVDEVLKDDTGNKKHYRRRNNHQQRNFGKKYSRNRKY